MSCRAWCGGGEGRLRFSSYRCSCLGGRGKGDCITEERKGSPLATTVFSRCPQGASASHPSQAGLTAQHTPTFQLNALRWKEGMCGSVSTMNLPSKCTKCVGTEGGQTTGSKGVVPSPLPRPGTHWKALPRMSILEGFTAGTPILVASDPMSHRFTVMRACHGCTARTHASGGNQLICVCCGGGGGGLEFRFYYEGSSLTIMRACHGCTSAGGAYYQRKISASIAYWPPSAGAMTKATWRRTVRGTPPGCHLATSDWRPETVAMYPLAEEATSLAEVRPRAWRAQDARWGGRSG